MFVDTNVKSNFGVFFAKYSNLKIKLIKILCYLNPNSPTVKYISTISMFNVLFLKPMF